MTTPAHVCGCGFTSNHQSAFSRHQYSAKHKRWEESKTKITQKSDQLDTIMEMLLDARKTIKELEAENAMLREQTNFTTDIRNIQGTNIGLVLSRSPPCLEDMRKVGFNMKKYIIDVLLAERCILYANKTLYVYVMGNWTSDEATTIIQSTIRETCSGKNGWTEFCRDCDSGDDIKLSMEALDTIESCDIFSNTPFNKFS